MAQLDVDLRVTPGLAYGDAALQTSQHTETLPCLHDFAPGGPGGEAVRPEAFPNSLASGRAPASRVAQLLKAREARSRQP